jgi:hypothetical protein
MGHNVNEIKLGPKLHHIPNFMAWGLHNWRFYKSIKLKNYIRSFVKPRNKTKIGSSFQNLNWQH